MRRYLKLLVPVIFCGASINAYAGDIEVNVSGIRPVKGGVIVSLWDEDGYLKESLQEIYIELTDQETVTATFTDIAAGTYALGAIHDKNGNKKMDTNFLGIPKEKGGFSNNAPAKMGPAKFEKAAFIVGAEKVVQDIAVRKPK